jgi:hypothetical protein
MNTKMTKQLANLILDDVKTALEAVGQKHGVVFARTLGGSLDAESLHFKMECRIGNGNPGDAYALEGIKFEKMALSFDLDPKWLGEKFKNGDRGIFKIVGLNPNRPKYCVIAKREGDGKVLLFPADTIKYRMTVSRIK